MKSFPICRWQNAVTSRKVTCWRPFCPSSTNLAYAFRIIRLHGDGVALQDRVWALSQVVRERRVEKGVGHNPGTPQVFLGHVQCGFGRQPHHCPSWRGVLWLSRPQEKKYYQCHICHGPTGNTAYPCPPLFRVRTTTSTTSPRYFGDCSQGLRLQAFPYRDSSSTQMLVLTQNSSGVCIRDMGLSKHRLQEAQREEEFLDELLYKERYSIERTNAWMDSYRSVLNRFDTTLASWKGWNYVAFILILHSLETVQS